MVTNAYRYAEYLKALTKPFKKLAKLEFLQPDNSVAFSLDNNYKRGYMTKYDTRAFIQSGTLNVSLHNGARRQATVELSNIDGAFDYNVNKLWFGQQVRLSMGLVLPDGTDFYLPQGVFYLENPKKSISPTARTITYNLTDKWAYLDGSLFGTLETTYQIPMYTGSERTDIFKAMADVLHLSRIDFSSNEEDITKQIDNVLPTFTTFYNNRSYQVVNGPDTLMTQLPYDITVSPDNGTLATILLELNTIIAGWIGYDQTGALRVEPSQDDISDTDKPIIWAFTPQNSILCGIEEIVNNKDVYNDVIIVGEGMNDGEVYGRASNFDPRSDTNINIIGRKTYREQKAEYWNAEQCVDLAKFYLKRKTVLQKSITIESSQLFHLLENRLVSVQRTDKEGSPVEKHLIESFSLPIGETGTMSITATSINDFPNFTITSSQELN